MIFFKFQFFAGFKLIVVKANSFITQEETIRTGGAAVGG